MDVRAGVKSLGRWHEVALSDRHRGLGFRSKREGRLGGLVPGKAKLWCCQFVLLPHVLWQMLVYEVAVTSLERMQPMMNVCCKNWLGVPRMLSGGKSVFGHDERVCRCIQRSNEAPG